ncbi:MAG: hypothetical protein A4E56_02700 [Pelotomaculum sp. PtaU1.Bin065]|nr:MAG: hypothetical protein A4E56_02700 [Pelotomaculum sp. PtaU1.Bin065]
MEMAARDLRVAEISATGLVSTRDHFVPATGAYAMNLDTPSKSQRVTPLSPLVIFCAAAVKLGSRPLSCKRFSFITKF